MKGENDMYINLYHSRVMGKELQKYRLLEVQRTPKYRQAGGWNPPFFKKLLIIIQSRISNRQNRKGSELGYAS
jgi:hypothetical protein